MKTGTLSKTLAQLIKDFTDVQLAASPLRTTVESAQELVKGMSPDLVRQLLPVLDQLSPIYLDVSQGRQEFVPSPQESQQLLNTYYGEAPAGHTCSCCAQMSFVLLQHVCLRYSIRLVQSLPFSRYSALVCVALGCAASPLCA